MGPRHTPSSNGVPDMVKRAPDESSLSRRDFMTGVAAVWISASMACSREAEKAATTTPAAAPPAMIDAPAPPKTLAHLSAEQGVEIEAIAARIIPSDDSPGAREAGVLYFIDGSLGTFAKDQMPLFTAGLTALSKTVAKSHAGQRKFSALTPEQQDAVLRGMEQTPFFGAMRFATIAGFLALPKYGGNRDYVGWKFIGQEHALEQHPPFGWYDRPENQQALLGRVL